MNYVLKNDDRNEIEVEKSRFISIAKYFENPAEVKDFLNLLRKENPKARHVCYAYKIGGQVKYSDDGEPSGTAGRPLLNLLEQNNLDNAAVFVIRYFGGTLLGAGRLLRTYVEAGKQVLDKIEKVEIVEENYFKVSVTYDCFDQFKYYLNNMRFCITKTEFSDRINIEFYAPLDYVNNLEELFFGKVKLENVETRSHRKE